RRNSSRKPCICGKAVENHRRNSHETWAYPRVRSAIGVCVLQNTGKRHFREVGSFLRLRKKIADYSEKMNACDRNVMCSKKLSASFRASLRKGSVHCRAESPGCCSAALRGPGRFQERLRRLETP